MAPMPSARYHHGVVEHGGKLYVVGGYDGTNLNTCVVFDFVTGVWTAISPMASARQQFGVASF